MTGDGDPTVVLGRDLLDAYRMVSLYNSPYAAHDRGRAVDLYPDPGSAPSPVGGEVVDVRSVDAPSKPYAEAEDHLILIDVEEGDVAPRERDLTARILHVDPEVDPGDSVAVGDHLGRTIRSGFFAPWVDDHLHVGFRLPEANHYRAAGSLAVELGVDPVGVEWDGTGTVVETGETYVLLDRPEHPGRGFAGIGADGGGVLDGGLPHYEKGGLLGGPGGPVAVLGGDEGTVSLLGAQVGDADGRTVEWDGPTVRAGSDPITGLSLYLGRERAGAKLVCPGHDFELGQRVRVRID